MWGSSGITEVASKRALPPNNLRPRSKEAVTIENMSKDLMCGKRLYDKLKNQARQQLALMNRNRMLSRRTGRVGGQPFYVQFLNR